MDQVILDHVPRTTPSSFSENWGHHFHPACARRGTTLAITNTRLINSSVNYRFPCSCGNLLMYL
uniref:Uncharacterized protein MANES_09G184700 n=1 Tax=Rhizophora mucronata TaxID=61149 RepID=A0A2P2MHH0_RHIMU